MRKRRHHVVWKHYLQAWAPGGTLFCLQGGSVFETGPGQIGVQRDFYALDKLSDLELDFVRGFAGYEASERERKETEEWLDFLMIPARFSEALRRSGVRAADPAFARLQNFEEDFQSHVENSSFELLANLRNRDSRASSRSLLNLPE